VDFFSLEIYGAVSFANPSPLEATTLGHSGEDPLPAAFEVRDLLARGLDSIRRELDQGFLRVALLFRRLGRAYRAA
jgi:hypothetical protein